MKRIALLVLICLLGAGGARADECAARAADLARETGAAFMRRSSLKIFLKLKDFKEMNVNCRPLGVEVTIALGMPPDDFFQLIAEAAHLVADLPIAPVKAGAIKCHKAALRTDNAEPITSIDLKGINIECDAALTGTGETTIRVFRAPP